MANGRIFAARDRACGVGNQQTRRRCGFTVAYEASAKGSPTQNQVHVTKTGDRHHQESQIKAREGKTRRLNAEKALAILIGLPCLWSGLREFRADWPGRPYEIIGLWQDNGGLLAANLKSRTGFPEFAEGCFKARNAKASVRRVIGKGARSISTCFIGYMFICSNITVSYKHMFICSLFLRNRVY